MEKKKHIIKVKAIRDKKLLNDFIKELKQGKNGARNSLIFKLDLTTGLRISDIVKIKIEDIKGKIEFELVEQKTNKKRKVYLHSILSYLTDFINTLENTEEWLFSNSWDNSKHITSNQYYKILQKVALELDLDYIETHTMRKTLGY